jgi:hypothetical protein
MSAIFFVCQMCAAELSYLTYCCRYRIIYFATVEDRSCNWFYYKTLYVYFFCTYVCFHPVLMLLVHASFFTVVVFIMDQAHNAGGDQGGINPRPSHN